MTRTKDQSAGHPNANSLQPTKLSSRRVAETATLKVEDAKHVTIPRDIFHPDVITSRTQIKIDDGSGDQENHDDKIRLSKQRPAPKVGLGPVIFNLKPHHFHNSKKNGDAALSIPLDYYKKKYPAKAGVNGAAQSSPDDDNEDLCDSIKKLSIKGDKSKKVKEVKPKHLLQDSFKKLVSLRSSYESGQTVSVRIDESKCKQFKKSSSAIRKAGVRNWKSPEGHEDIHSGLVRNLFSWSLPTSTRWKEVEERVLRWIELSKQGGYSFKSEDVAELLNVTPQELERLEFHKDLSKVVSVLKNHICHSSLPWLTTLSAVAELQKGSLIGATQNAAESQGTFLHSEIVDKHICYLSRNEDPNNAPNQPSSFSTKTELFRKQIQDTVGFGKDVAGVGADSAFAKSISTFNPDWNIIQITALMQSKNRFGMDLYGQRQIPQLLLSSMAHIPKESERSTFTAFCPDPPVCEGSLMRLGLMEEFQKILDRNLIISDDSVVISRRNYWEERGKHNQAMKSVIQAMEEEWIGPWNFLLPGHTTHRDIQDKICSKVVAPSAKKYKLSSAQKLLLYKLTENYKYLHLTTTSGLETVVAFILKVPETGLGTLCKRIREIGSEVPVEDRHPTILVVDQDLEIYPWESMNCLLSTDVTRMPSINLIRSNYNFVTSLRPTYPNIVDTSSCTFVLNPDGTLPNVQKRLEGYFLEHKKWSPVIGRPPATKEVQDCLENQHIFLYNGHGAGSNFYPDYAVQKLVCQAVPLLMGCASAQAHYAVPRVYGSATIHSYFLAGCPSVVGYLWEITDAECDRITVDLIERWLPDKNIRPPKILFFDRDAKREREKCLSTAMRISRKAATQYLTQCAIVCYGLPVNTQE